MLPSAGPGTSLAGCPYDRLAVIVAADVDMVNLLTAVTDVRCFGRQGPERHTSRRGGDIPPTSPEHISIM
jgi:hypothetical protein